LREKVPNAALEMSQSFIVAALTYLSDNEDALHRFLAESGLAAEELRQLSESEELLAGLVDYFLANEALLMAFCEQHDISTEDVWRVRRALNKDADAWL